MLCLPLATFTTRGFGQGGRQDDGGEEGGHLDKEVEVEVKRERQINMRLGGHFNEVINWRWSGHYKDEATLDSQLNA